MFDIFRINNEKDIKFALIMNVLITGSIGRIQWYVACFIAEAFWCLVVILIVLHRFRIYSRHLLITTNF